MAMCGSEERRVLTILWRMKSDGLYIGPFLKTRCLQSKIVQLFLFKKNEGGKDKNIYFQLRMYENDPLEFPIDCEWSFIGSNGSSLASGTMRNQVMDGKEPLNMSGCPTYEEVFVTRRSAFLSNDTLTVRFRIWSSDGSFSNDELISCRSKVEDMDHFFLWVIPQFSALQLNKKVTTFVRLGDTFVSENFLLKFSLKGKTLEDASVNVELTPCSISDVCFVKLKVSALDNKQKVIASTKIEHEGFLEGVNKTHELPELTSRKELLRKKSDCLRNDMLTLGCLMSIIWSKNVIDKYYQGVSGLEKHLTKDIRKHNTSDFCSHIKANFSTCLDASCQTSEQSVEQPNISLQRKDSSIFLGEDLLSLYREQSLTDFELHSGNVSFPVHKNILSARSPVFKAMFSNGVKESDSNFQDVPDLDIHTLNRMLTFMYGGNVEPDLHFESAAELYYAAKKYQVESLKQQCSSIIKSGVSIANVSDILTLAHRHRDEDLKLFVHDFFLENFDEILRSEEWKTFQLIEPALAGNTKLQIYKKRHDKKRP